MVERNLCTGNGAGGGAALNLASLRQSDVRNNVLSGNLGQSGIVLWDDGNLNGGAGPGFGSKDNRIWHNTVVFAAGVGRYCLSLSNGSTGNDVRNNVLRGGARGAIAFTSDSLPGLVEDYDLVSSASGWPLFVDDATNQTYTLAQWRQLVNGAQHDVAGSPWFTRAAWHELALLDHSPGKSAGANLGVGLTYEGAPRPAAGADIGACQR